MSYQAQALLTADATFQGRTIAAATQQAAVPGVGDTTPAAAATAAAVQRGQADVLLAFTRLDAAGPGIADRVDNGDGTIDQAKVGDSDLLSLTQAVWPVVAGLYFSEDGSPKP